MALLALCKKGLQNLDINFLFTHIEKKSTVKIKQNQSLRAVQKKVLPKPRKILEEYLYIIPFLALDFLAVRCPSKEIEVYIFSL